MLLENELEVLALKWCWKARSGINCVEAWISLSDS